MLRHADELRKERARFSDGGSPFLYLTALPLLRNRIKERGMRRDAAPSRPNGASPAP